MKATWYAADFETTTDPDDCRVWAWAFTDISRPYDLLYGNSVDSFMEALADLSGRVYFHNLKFDGRFIVDWLLRNGYDWNGERSLPPQTFKTLISDMGAWYSIKIRFPNTKAGIKREVTIYDSLKILPMKISQMTKSFGIEEHKLELDYKEYREIGHELTQHEKDYISGDVIILAKALAFMREHQQHKMTTGSNAINDYKTRIGKNVYTKWFPEVDAFTDKDIRQSYKGGFTYLNPKYKNADIGAGNVYDVNSMYPWAMRYCLLPYGEPVYFSGDYVEDKNCPLYVLNFECTFKIKPGHIPSIQIKHSMLYAENEYLTESDGPVVLTLTNIDLQLMKDQYDMNIIEVFGGYKFRAAYDMFNVYIDYWYSMKTTARAEGNPGLEKIAKLSLNSLYGKFGTRKTTKSKIPYLDREKNIVRYYTSSEEQVKGGYIPIATFITAYARDKIIRGAQACGDRFVYADTDSLHVVGTEPIPGLDVDNKRLGAFKLESTFTKARFIRQKTYMEIFEREINIKCAGMPDEIKNKLHPEDFYEGATFDGKLLPKVVPGGVILEDTTFQIKKA